MKTLLLIALLFSAVSCSDELIVKPSSKTKKVLVFTREEAEILFDKGKGGGTPEGCLKGSPEGYCCNWGGQIVMCREL